MLIPRARRHHPALADTAGQVAAEAGTAAVAAATDAVDAVAEGALTLGHAGLTGLLAAPAERTSRTGAPRRRAGHPARGTRTRAATARRTPYPTVGRATGPAARRAADPAARRATDPAARHATDPPGPDASSARSAARARDSGPAVPRAGAAPPGRAHDSTATGSRVAPVLLFQRMTRARHHRDGQQHQQAFHGPYLRHGARFSRDQRARASRPTVTISTACRRA
jgi:hypothetical protein